MSQARNKNEPNPIARRLDDVEAVREREHAPVTDVTAIGSSHDASLVTNIDLTASHIANRPFGEYYSSSYAKLARGLQLTLGDRDLGAEAADEAMTRAYARWHQVSGYSNLDGWLYRVGLNWALSFRRRAARRLPWVETATSEMPPASDPQLQEALLRLDVKYRSVVVCRHLLDWSTDQTADALGIASGTVKSRLSKALAQLRSTLSSDEGETR